MKNLIQAAVVTLFVASTAQAQQAVQWKVSDGGNGHWYQAVSVGHPVSWDAARDACVALGGHLATITTEAEGALLRNAVQSADWGQFGPWLGGFQDASAADFSEPSGGWRWITGEPWTWATWDDPSGVEPNNSPCSPQDEDRLHYIGCAGAAMHWNDLPASGTSNCCGGSSSVGSYLIEWSADCNGDGIVDYGQCRDGSLPDYNGNNVPDCCEQGSPCVVGSYPLQWRVSEGGNGHWYQLDVSGRTWHAARSVAEASGGYLACISSAGENIVVTNLSRTPAWLGGYQDLNSPRYSEPAGAWKWVSGEPWVFTNWYLNDPNNPPEPNNAGPEHVLITWSLQVYWNDINENGTAPSLREWSADCNNDGLVDKGQILLGHLPDANNNGVPDTCEPPSLDCNANSIRDDGEIASGRALDYNANQIPDECDSAMGLPRIRSMVLNRGPGNGPGYCGTWDTRDDPWSLWNLWVSRTGVDGPWINAQDPSAGLPLALEMQLLPGDNVLTIRHDFNGCDGQTQNVHLWLNDLDLPSVSCLGGVVPSPFSGLVVGPSGGNHVAAAGTLHARVGAWNVRIESFTWSLGSDRVGNFVPQPNGVADNVSTVRIRVYKDCPCDVFRDFNVNGADLGILLSQWGITNQYTVTDFNDDGSVNGVDLGLLLAAWGPCPD